MCTESITEIKKIIISLYINRYKLFRNIFNSNKKTGYELISQNNQDYENISNDMKRLIYIIEYMKKYHLKIDTNIKYIEYSYFYKNQIDYEVISYKNKEAEIVESLFFGINNFIYSIIYTLNNDIEKQKSLLDLSNVYKKVEHNLSIVNLTLDNSLMNYYKQKTNIKIDICKKILLNIKVKYNHKYKTKIETVQEEKLNYSLFNKEIKKIDIKYINKKQIFKDIIIIDYTKNSTFMNTLENCISGNSIYMLNDDFLKSKKKQNKRRNLLYSRKQNSKEYTCNYFYYNILFYVIITYICVKLNYIYYFDLWKKLHIVK